MADSHQNNIEPTTEGADTKTSSPVVPRVESSTLVASTKWLALQTLDWVGPDGVHRAWDCATRTTKSKDGAADAVIIVPLLRDSNNNNNKTTLDTLLVEQFRPPVQTTTLEFPAGLIDAGETIEQAALRELREETGYVGTATVVAQQQLCMSPGLCNETVHVVLVDVDLKDPRNINATPDLDEGEFCTVRRVSLDTGLKTLLLDGEGSSSSNNKMPLMGLYMFALGWELGRQQSSSSPSSSTGSS